MTRQTIGHSWKSERLAILRQAMDQQDMDGLIVPRWDAHQSEYVTTRDERLAWVSGFTGTWGLAIVLREKAAIFVDGRYTVQVRDEVDAGEFELRHLYDDPPTQWLAKTAKRGGRIGFDPMVVPPVLYQEFKAALDEAGVEFAAIEQSPVDAVWAERPAASSGKAFALPVSQTGESSASKRERLAQALRDAKIDLLVETQCDNLAWLLNLRGRDIPENPFLQGFALIDAGGGLSFYTDQSKLDADDAFEFEGVQLLPTAQFASDLQARLEDKITVGVDPKFGPALPMILAEQTEAEVVIGPNPLTMLKAVKNSAEIAGMTEAGVLDAEVLAELYSWLDQCVDERSASNVPVTEKEIETKLEALRQTKPGYVEPSFIPISASGPNGAMCHYNAPSEGSLQLGGNAVFLLDTGGQYRCGTTDTTRTTIFGEPAREQIEAYTLVLKGHIALASQRFPVGTRGYQIDMLARQFLWQAHKDYDHGTGHGVGHFLSVHEHPQRLSKDPLDVAIKAGMNLTIEPGFYVADEYGIRIENLYQVIEIAPGWLGFEALMHFPIGREMLDTSLLTTAERQWLDEYHAKTAQVLSSERLSDEARQWVTQQTVPLGYAQCSLTRRMAQG